MRILYALCAVWALYNFATAATCGSGKVSPFYWPPITECRP